MNKTVSVLPADLTEPELVLFVGYPSSGKSTYYRRQFQPSGYEHVNQDKLKSRPNCLKAVKTAIEAGKSCVVGEAYSLKPNEGTTSNVRFSDNTNRDRATRKEYTSLAAKLGAPVR
jgi:bifunctional polynucleotide phosphatase/kinase